LFKKSDVRQVRLIDKVQTFTRIRLRRLDNLKSSLTYFLHYIRYKLRKRYNRYERIVQFNLEKNALRYFMGLAYYFHLNNFAVKIYSTPANYLSLRQHKFTREIINLPGFQLSLRKNNKNVSVILSDSISSFHKIKTFGYDYFTKKKPVSIYRIPLTFHPENLLQDNFSRSKIEPNSDNRNVRLFFIGNMNEKAYTGSSLKKHFDCLTRVETCRIIKERFDEKLVKIPSSVSEVHQAFEYKIPIVICDGKKNPIWHTNYFKLLAESHFFLAASGVFMPHSHNVIEAMAAGCIPLIEYEEWFTPKLTHLQNCIAFSGSSDLIKKVELILKLTEKEISDLRIGVLNYYQDHLTPESVVGKIINNDESAILLNSEGYSVSLMNKIEL